MSSRPRRRARRHMLRRMLGHPVYLFAYPAGDFNDQVVGGGPCRRLHDGLHHRGRHHREHRGAADDAPPARRPRHHPERADRRARRPVPGRRVPRGPQPGRQQSAGRRRGRRRRMRDNGGGRCDGCSHWSGSARRRSSCSAWEVASRKRPRPAPTCSPPPRPPAHTRRRSPATGCSASACRRRARDTRRGPSPPSPSSPASTPSRPGDVQQRANIPTWSTLTFSDGGEQFSASSAGHDRLAPVDRPAHRRGHHDRALEGAQRPRHRAHLPGADRSGPTQHRRSSAAADAAVVRDRHGDRRDRRHARQPEHRGDQGLGRPTPLRTGSRSRREGTGIQAAIASQLHTSANIDVTTTHVDQSAAQSVGQQLSFPVTAGQTYMITKYVAVDSSQTGPDPVAAVQDAGGQGRRARAGARCCAPATPPGRRCGRADRRARQPRAGHRRQRQRVLSVVEHARRRRLERVAGGPLVQRLRRPHLLGRGDVDVPVAAGPASGPGGGR